MAATGYIILGMAGALQPDGSGTGNNPASPALDVSTGVQATNSPKVTQFAWDFLTPASAALEQHLMWTFNLPMNVGGGLFIRLKWKMLTANTGAVNFKASSYSGLDNFVNHNQAVFDAVQTAGALTVPGTLGFISEFAFSLASVSAASNRLTTVMIGSEFTGWTATGVLRLLAATVEYSIP
jgi:hypothetical protein